MQSKSESFARKRQQKQILMKHNIHLQRYLVKQTLHWMHLPVWISLVQTSSLPWQAATNSATAARSAKHNCRSGLLRQAIHGGLYSLSSVTPNANTCKDSLHCEINCNTVLCSIYYESSLADDMALSNICTAFYCIWQRVGKNLHCVHKSSHL